MKRKMLCTFLALTLVLSISACGGQSSNPANTTGPSATDAAVDSTAAAGSTTTNSSEKVVLRYSWWGGDERHEATLKNLERYSELHPNVTFQPEYGAYSAALEKLYVQLASRTLPDIPSVDGKWVQDMIRNYKDSFVNFKDLDINMSDYDPEFVRLICGNDEFTLGVSNGTNSFGLIYSVPFFEKFGLSDPNTWDWEDYLEAGKKVQQQDPEAHLMTGLMHTFGYMFKYHIKQKTGKDIIDDNYNVVMTVEDATWGWEYIKQIIDTGTYPSMEEFMPYADQYPHQIPKWLEGKLGMTLTQTSSLSALVDETPFELKTTRVPLMEDALSPGFPISSGMVATISSYGHVEEAAKFLNWYVNDDEAIRITGDTRGIPSNTRAAKLLADEGVLMSQMIEFNEKAAQVGTTVESLGTVNATVLDALNEYAQQVGYGKMTPAQAAVGVIEALKELCEDIKNKS